MGETEVEGRFLAVRELAQQLDVLIDSQQKLSVSVRDIPDVEKSDTMYFQDALIQNYVKLSRKIDPGLALALYIQEALWESYTDIDSLWKMNPWCSSDQFDYSFEQYACARLDRQWVTITNWLQTAKIHFVEDHAPKEPIALIDAKTGQPLLEQIGNETRPIVQKWDPLNVDFSKLLLCNRLARENKLGDIGYGLLANPHTRWIDIRDFLHNLMPWREREIREGELKFFVQNALLWVSDGVRSGIMASLEWDSEDMLIRQGVAKLIRALGIVIK